MRKLLVYSIVVLLGLAAKAQQNIVGDSIYLYSQTSRQMEWAHSSATHLLFRNYQLAARSSVYAGHEQGGYHLSPEAYRQTTAGFHTDGAKKLKRFTLAGAFDFEKGWEDSAAWYNSGEYNVAQPYFFFAGKAGKYEKQLYNLTATAAYELLTNKLYVGISGRYRYHWTTRSVDPRPDVRDLNTLFKPEITWQHGNHLLGAGYIWGRGSQDINVSYANPNYRGNQTYVDRINFMSLGFGYIGKLQQYLQHYNETTGFFAHYATRFNQWELQTSGGYERWVNDITIELTSNRNHHNNYAYLEQNKIVGGLLLNHHRNKSRQQLELNIDTRDLKNWASEFNANSYQFDATEARFAFSQQWQRRNGISVELGAGCTYKEQSKKDAISAHAHQFQTATPHLIAAVYRQAPGKSWLAWSLMPSFRYTLTNDLNVPATQETYFTQGIVYPDYLYWDKNVMALETKFNFMQKEKSKRNRLGFTVSAKWQEAMDAGATTLNALYIPAGSRWSAGAAINLYL